MTWQPPRAAPFGRNGLARQGLEGRWKRQATRYASDMLIFKCSSFWRNICLAGIIYLSTKRTTLWPGHRAPVQQKPIFLGVLLNLDISNTLYCEKKSLRGFSFSLFRVALLHATSQQARAALEQFKPHIHSRLRRLEVKRILHKCYWLCRGG